MENQKDWRYYERLIAAFEAENTDIEISITPNAKLTGKISNQVRQIDLLIDARWDNDFSRRIIVDAKYHRTKLDIKDVESFEGMMRDCQAERGILVCPKGWTKGAKTRAQDAITIKLLSIQELENTTSWASFEDCLGDCYLSQKEKAHQGIVIWDSQYVIERNHKVSIVFSGKCDVCHNFHIWCWECGERFAISDNNEYECHCGRRWMTPIEQEKFKQRNIKAVHLTVIEDGNMSLLDRRRLV